METTSLQPGKTYLVTIRRGPTIPEQILIGSYLYTDEGGNLRFRTMPDGDTWAIDPDNILQIDTTKLGHARPRGLRGAALKRARPMARPVPGAINKRS